MAKSRGWGFAGIAGLGGGFLANSCWSSIPSRASGLALAIERLMQKELGDQHHRQKAWASKSARDRMGRRRRLGNRLAIPARELLPHVLDELPSPRLAFQRLRHHLAELAQPNTAAFCTGAWRRFDDPLNRQIIRQRLARRPRGCGPPAGRIEFVSIIQLSAAEPDGRWPR